MSAASEARKVLDRAATKFGAGALTTEGDAVAYVNARDALIAAVRAEERARCVAEREAEAMFATLTGERVFVGGCRIVSDKTVPLDEAHLYDHLGNLTGRITGLTAALTGADK